MKRKKSKRQIQAEKERILRHNHEAMKNMFPEPEQVASNRTQLEMLHKLRKSLDPMYDPRHSVKWNGFRNSGLKQQPYAEHVPPPARGRESPDRKKEKRSVVWHWHVKPPKGKRPRR